MGKHVKTGTIMRVDGTTVRVTMGADNVDAHVEAVVGFDPRVQEYRDGTMYTARVQAPRGGSWDGTKIIPPVNRNQQATDYSNREIPEFGALGCCIYEDAIFIDR